MQITLPISQQTITVRRASITHWIRRNQCPRWYSLIYFERGQNRITQEEMTDRIAAAAPEDLIAMQAFEDFLVQYAVKGQEVDLNELDAEDYEAILNYARLGVIPGETLDEEEGDSQDEALSSFRAQP